MGSSALQLALQAGPVVKGVLVILFAFSVVSWAIILFKYRYLSKARKESAAFYKAFSKSQNLKGLYSVFKKDTLSPLSNVFCNIYAETSRYEKVEIRRTLKRFEALESSKLMQYLTFLATTGSTTPFIGLFGTVWGIMNSFRGIGATGSASLAVVAPGIAEALIATAMGLAAAIPAVIAYNYFLSKARYMIVEMEDFSEELLDVFLRMHQ